MAAVRTVAVRHETLPADLASFAAMRCDLADSLAELGWADVDVFRVLVCVDDAVANAITHRSSDDDRVAVGYRVTETNASFRIANATDPGTRLPDIATPHGADEHGRGMLLMRALADRFRVVCRDGVASVGLVFVPGSPNDSGDA